MARTTQIYSKKKQTHYYVVILIMGLCLPLVIRGRSTCEFCLFAEEIGGGDIDHRGRHGDGARTETSTRAGRELQKLSPRCLAGWLDGWQRAGGEYFSRRAESIASTSPKSGRDARRVCHDFFTLICICGTFLLFFPQAVSYQG